MIIIIEKFFKHYPQFTNNSIYLFGSGSSASFIPKLALNIIKKIPNINLAGIALGNGWVDPISQCKNSTSFHFDDQSHLSFFLSKDGAYPEYGLENNLVNKITYLLMQSELGICNTLLSNQDFEAASDECQLMVDTINSVNEGKVNSLRKESFLNFFFFFI